MGCDWVVARGTHPKEAYKATKLLDYKGNWVGLLSRKGLSPAEIHTGRVFPQSRTCHKPGITSGGGGG